MAESAELKKFNKSHPWPDKCDISSLFRFYTIDLKRVERLRHLFVECKLYHPLPTQFNDPFECKPHFSWPKDAKKVRDIRQYLIKLAREKGRSKKEAEAIISKQMKKPKFIQDTIFNAIQRAYSELRICSFTTQKENLLFWSHYANSHKGFCVEFDATKMPIAYAYKVQYKNKYPEVVYPRPNDATAFIPALVKSKIWKYEREYRTIFVPEAINQPANDGESLILRGDEIKNIYLGSNIEEDEKEVIFDLVGNGNFDPSIWTTNLSKSTFSLEFIRVV